MVQNLIGTDIEMLTVPAAIAVNMGDYSVNIGATLSLSDLSGRVVLTTGHNLTQDSHVLQIGHLPAYIPFLSLAMPCGKLEKYC